MRYGSICSGIEAATMAWHGLGWKPAFFSEIDNFPRAVLQHHYPDVPLHGDFTTINGDEYGHIDLLVGGTPCQDFSIAGLRAGLAGERGNLTLEFARLVDRMRPQWIVWENVPGVLSIDGGRAFGSFLGALAEIGYGFAYRILDAQYFGVPQRRRRVFVVGYFGDWRRAAAVLFERESLLGNPAPRREAGKGVAPTISARPSGGGGLGTDFDCDGGLIAHALRAEGFDASEDGTGRGTPLVTVHFQGRGSNIDVGQDVAGTLGSNADRASGGAPCIAFSIMPMNSGKDYKARETDIAQPIMAGGPVGGNQGGDFIVEPVPFDTTQITSAANYSKPKAGDPCHPLAAGAHAPAIAFGWQNSARQGASASASVTPTLDKSKTPAIACNGVRRLTPRECERLQGFPDDYTLVPYRNKPAADGPRYKALGNSMAVPCMAWIGERIELIETLTKRIV